MTLWGRWLQKAHWGTNRSRNLYSQLLWCEMNSCILVPKFIFLMLNYVRVLLFKRKTHVFTLPGEWPGTLCVLSTYLTTELLLFYSHCYRPLFLFEELFQDSSFSALICIIQQGTNSMLWLPYKIWWTYLPSKSNLSPAADPYPSHLLLLIMFQPTTVERSPAPQKATPAARSPGRHPHLWTFPTPKVLPHTPSPVRPSATCTTCLKLDTGPMTRIILLKALGEAFRLSNHSLLWRFIPTEVGTVLNLTQLHAPTHPLCSLKSSSLSADSPTSLLIFSFTFWL